MKVYTKIVPFLSVALLLSACNGTAVEPLPESPQPSPCENFSGSTTDPLYLRIYCVTEFDNVAVNAARDLFEFAAQQYEWYFTGAPQKIYSSFSLRAVRAEYAHSVGLSGAGETIAIVDNWFDLSHPELQNKNITVYGENNPTDEDHGTGVAAIAAGSNDDEGMMGIAYNADLHLHSHENTMTDLINATNDARLSGAIVQNNSWNWDSALISDVLNRAEGVSAEQGFADAIIGLNLFDATAYLQALEDFTQNGVIVFANSNDFNATELPLMPGLPLAFPELEQGWITVLNGVPTFDENGNIVSAERLSAQCFEVAYSCLMAEGAVYSAVGANSYDIMLGTSFAAPIISGGVAILAEAFPSLSGPEIRNRMLFTADNSFFTPDGYLDFTAELSHGYSSEYGHGFMNLEAALLPIGEIGIPVGAQVADGIEAVDTSTLIVSSALGDSISRALDGVDIMLLDTLGGDFTMPASGLIAATPESSIPENLATFLGDETHSFLPSILKAAAASLSNEKPYQIYGGNSTEVLQALDLEVDNVGLAFDPVNIMGLSGDEAAFGLSANFGGSWGASIRGHSNAVDAYGFGVSIHAENAKGAFSFGFSTLHEQGASLGMRTLSLAPEANGNSSSIDFGFSQKLSDDLEFELSGQIGASSSSASGIWSGQSGATFSAFAANLHRDNLLTNNDRLSFTVRQPIAIDSGSMIAMIPQSRTVDGDIITEALNVGLAPNGRQIDLGLEYEISFGGNQLLTLGGAYSSNAGNIEGRDGFGFAAKYSLVF